MTMYVGGGSFSQGFSVEGTLIAFNDHLFYTSEGTFSFILVIYDY